MTRVFSGQVSLGTIFPMRVNCGASPGKGRAKQEGEARQTAGKRAEATSEALENVWIGNESR